MSSVVPKRVGTGKFSVPNGFQRMPELQQASAATMGVYLASYSYCSEWVTDGRLVQLPATANTIARLFGMDEAEVQLAMTELEKLQLWVEDDGWLTVPKYLEDNPDKAALEEMILGKSVGGKRGNHKRWHTTPEKKHPEWCAGCAAELAQGQDSADSPPPAADERLVSDDDADDTTSAPKDGVAPQIPPGAPFPTRAASGATLSQTLGAWAQAHDLQPGGGWDAPLPARYGFLLDLLKSNLDPASSEFFQLATRVICDYVAKATGEQLGVPDRKQADRLVRSHGAPTVLRVVSMAVENGAGLDPEHANKTRPLINYARGILANEASAATRPPSVP